MKCSHLTHGTVDSGKSNAAEIKEMEFYIRILAFIISRSNSDNSRHTATSLKEQRLYVWVFPVNPKILVTFQHFR